MKRKIIAFTLAVAIVAEATACGGVTKETANIEIPADAEEKVSEVVENVDTDIIEDVAPALIEVEKEVFDVELTIPADYMEGITQEDLDVTQKEKGYMSATLNDDGSVTYVISKSQHKAMMAEVAESIEQSMNELLLDENYSFTSIEANDNYTDFTVAMSSSELNITESLSVLLFYIYGGMYSEFSGEKIDNVHVAFVNAETGDIISEANSKDMQE